MRVRAAAVLVALAAVCFAAPADEARALSCGAPEKPFSHYADVVFDGVLLSGPREGPLGRLASPARMHVFRYLKGRGPRQIEIGTDVPLLTPGDDSGAWGEVPGLFEPYAGEIYRVYGDVPKRAGSSARLGVYTPNPCGGTYGRRTGRFLRGLPGSRVAERDAGGRRWAAELLRGKGGVRCVRVHPGLDLDAIECDTHTAVAVAVVPGAGKLSDGTAATAVVVARPGLASIVVDGPGGRVERAAGGSGDLALALLPGYAEASDLRVTARMEDGAQEPLAGFGGGVLVAEPDRPERRWGVEALPAHPPVPGVRCARFAQRPIDTASAVGFRVVPRHGGCGRAEGFFAVRRITRYGDDERPHPYATIVFGIAPPDVARVTLAGPGGEREATVAGPGGAFAAMYGADVAHGDLAVTFHGGDGSARTLAGQRDWNVVAPPRTRLDRGH